MRVSARWARANRACAAQGPRLSARGRLCTHPVHGLHGARARVQVVGLGVAVVEAAAAIEHLAVGDHVQRLGVVARRHAAGVVCGRGTRGDRRGREAVSHSRTQAGSVGGRLNRLRPRNTPARTHSLAAARTDAVSHVALEVGAVHLVAVQRQLVRSGVAGLIAVGSGAARGRDGEVVEHRALQ